MRAPLAVWTAEQASDLTRAERLWIEAGHTPGTAHQFRLWNEQILREARPTDYLQLSAERVSRLAAKFSRERHHADPARTRWNWICAFRAFAWALRRCNKATGPTGFPAAVERDPAMVAFFRYGRSLGWEAQTVRAHRRHIDRLRRFLRRRGDSWPIPRLIDVDRFLHREAAHLGKLTLTSVAGSCRAWFRFLFFSGRLDQDFSQSVALPPSITLSQPPRALPWHMVRQLGKGINRRTTIGRRDYAQYLLFCAYGLSTAEVIGLRLNDIDWDARILHIRRAKNSAPVDLPLLPSVAKAIATYLEGGRPAAALVRNVFVRHCIPYGPLGRCCIGQRVKTWASIAHVRAPYLGAHLFRHSFATFQLEHGTPLKVIGDLLGHRSSQSTTVYVRSALARLRRLALPVPA